MRQDIINALKIIDYEIPDEDFEYFIGYVMCEHYGKEEPPEKEYRYRYPRLFRFLYNWIKPNLSPLYDFSDEVMKAVKV